MILYTDQIQRANPNFPIVDSNDVKGGLQAVNTLDDLYKIPKQKLTIGMLVFVVSKNNYYKYNNGNWIPLSLNNAGIPIYTPSMLKDLEEVPGNYISIPDEQELMQEYQQSTYLDILFSSIRALQAEVAKLRNAFKYGINSYNDSYTAIATTTDLNNSEEPLWAVDESSLSALLQCSSDMTVNHLLEGDVVVGDNVLHIGKQAVFNDPPDGFGVQTDPKTLIYLTTSSKNVIFKLSLDLDLNFNSIITKGSDIYNILVIFSKSNYIWVQVTDDNSNILHTGYYTGTGLQEKIYYLNNYHSIQQIYFSNMDLYKFNSYTKYQDFSQEIIPQHPDDTKYKFEAAHLTIRSVKTPEILASVSSQLQNNELIWVESTRSLCIKNGGIIQSIGKTSNSDNTMTIQELIASLENLGIIVTSHNNEYDIQLNNVSGITFIHQDTGKKFDITVDSEGNLRSSELGDNLLADRLKNLTLKDMDSRGFISKLRLAEAEAEKLITSDDYSKDAGLRSDRLKIGSVYSPIKGRTLFGCSHAFIELENTSDQDINLKGCDLCIATDKVYQLHLTGTIKAGGTYLIRGKQYASFQDVNTIIKVTDYDQEWYVNGELIDLQVEALSMMLIYNPDGSIIKSTDTYVSDNNGKWKVQSSNFIDGIHVRKNVGSWITGKFVITDAPNSDNVPIQRDYILKNTFELDPAKQAFQAINSADSSRTRGANKNDFKHFFIDSPIISFPHSDQIYDVSLITPKASHQNKNISTDKSKLDVNKPNMVYCSFGINVYKTRCFNWISVGSFDEFLWVRKQGEQNWKKFESYKPKNNVKRAAPPSQSPEEEISRKEFDAIINNTVYARISGRFPGDNSFYTAHKCIIDLPEAYSKTVYEYVVGRQLIDGNPDILHTSEIATFTLYPNTTQPKVYHITDQQGFYWMEYQTWAASAQAILTKIQEDSTTMPVIINTGDVTQNGTRVNEWLDYYNAGRCLFTKYEHMSVVGNNDLCGTDPFVLGTGDDIGKSNGYYHHLFNCYEITDTNLIINGKYVPSIYYFDAGNIRFINMNSEITFVNCRDWFDLAIGENTKDKPSDKAYNIYTGWSVGNNTAIEIPEYYKHDTVKDMSNFVPIYDTLYTWLEDAQLSDKKCIVACHEIPFTVMTRENLSVNPEIPGYTQSSRSVDGKGGALVGSHLNQLTKNDNKCLYWFSRLLEFFNVKLCIGGHKHTYTCTYPVREFYFYDTNKNSLTDGPKEMSYTLEQDDITWTYTIDYINENLLIKTNPSGKFDVEKQVFAPDHTTFHTSRLPLVNYTGTVKKVSYDGKSYTAVEYSNSDLDTLYLPIVKDSTMYSGVTYFMCQATGYKQTSNKELPGTAQAFSKILPMTSFNGSKDTADVGQQLPMFGIIDIGTSINIQLVRINNIQSSSGVPLYIDKYSSEPMYFQYLHLPSDGNDLEKRFGIWNTTNSNIIGSIKL